MIKRIWDAIRTPFLVAREKKIAGADSHLIPNDRMRIYHKPAGGCHEIVANDEAKDHLEYWPELKS